MKKVFWLAAVAAVMLAPRSGVGGFIEKSRFFGRMGERVEVPENTLRAYRFAIDNGFPVEFDLFLTRDGELVAVNDENLKAKTGIDKHPTQCNWKGELENVDIGAWKPGSWMGNWKNAGLRIARIDEILSLLPKNSRNQFHLRDNRLEAAKALRSALDRQDNVKEENIIFPVALPHLKELFPKAEFWFEAGGEDVAKTIADARSFGAKGVVVQWERVKAESDYISKCLKSDLAVHVRLEKNDPKEALEALRRGAESITSASVPFLYASVSGYASAGALTFDQSNLVAHRGESELEVENTLPAFTAAAKNGFALEMDLYLSRDGVVFCTHDNRIWQKHSGLPSGAWVTNLNWRGQLDKADAGAWKGEKWKGTGYARLEEVLPLIGKYGVWAIVEIKDPRKELIMSKVRPIIGSFDFLAPSNIVMAGAGTFMPGYKSTATCLMRDGWLADDKPRNLLGYARRLNPNTVALFSPRWDQQLVTEELVAAAHSRGVKVAVWTVNDAGIALEALRRGVDYVLSDRPIDMYREMREAYKAAWKGAGKNIAIPGLSGIIERSGNGNDDSRWYSRYFKVEPDCTYHLEFEMKSPGGGVAVTGIDELNVGLMDVCRDWTRKEYVFRTGSETFSQRVHFGQWHLKGRASFRNVQLRKVRAVHAENSGVVLGAGEQIEGGIYRYTSQFSGFARNDSRALLSARRVSYNSNRWHLGRRSEIVYRHKIASHKLKSAQLKVGSCYHTGGEARVEVSVDGNLWHCVGSVTNACEFTFDVPKKLFPADELRVRFLSHGAASLQISSYSLDAELEGDVVWVCGSTRYIDEEGKDVGGSKVSPYFAVDYGQTLMQTPSVALWRALSGRKIPPKRTLPSDKAAALEIATAANEAEAVQLVVTPKMKVDDLRVSLKGDLVSSAGKIPSAAVDILRVMYINVAQVSDYSGSRGLWPDPLLPQDSTPLTLEAGINQPFWVKVKPPKGTKRGLYRGELEVKMTCAGKVQLLSVPLKVGVFGFELPDTMTCSTAFGCNMAYPWRYHAAKTAQERATISKRYLDALAACHLSTYNPTPGVSWSVKWEGGKPHFDWERWDAAMEEAFSQRHINAFQIGVHGLGHGTFHSRTEPSINGVPATDPAYEKMMELYLKGVEDHLRKKGWLDKAYVYWFDEPDPKDYPFVMNGFNTLKRYAPGLRRMLTEHIADELIGGPNVWCPHTAGYEPVKTRERLAAGDEFWWYICCSPKAPYAGEFIDHPSNELRMWLWQTWGEGVSGILIWETLYWTSPEAYPDRAQNPYRDPMSWVTSYGTKKGSKLPWGNGDGRLFYPPLALADGDAEKFTDLAPVISFRSEGLRDGLEDYEYFVMLRRLDPDNKLLKVPQKIYSSLTEFSKDPFDIEKHRRKLAREIERLGRKR